MMSLIHTAVPWYATIPLAAAISRTLLVTTAASRARSLTARYVGLHPLRQALAVQKRDELLKKGNFRTPKEAVVLVKKEVNDMTSALDKRWNVTLAGQISWTLAQIPIFLAMAETIRQKCASHDGLLGMALSAFRSSDAADNIGKAAVTHSQWFEPSLATEGMLWFPNLLVPDPTGVLPFMLSGLMFANIYFTKNTVQNDAKWPNRIRRILLVVALLIGPSCQHLPAALMLYWGSSTTSVILSNFWLDWKYPAPRAFTACKRPLLMPPAPAARKPTTRRV
jgi:inner membrane protein COX18